MICDKDLKILIEQLDDQTNTKEKILLNRLCLRIFNINNQLKSSEAEKFIVMNDLINKKDLSIKDLLNLIKTIPMQVDVNRQFVVQYIKDILMKGEN